MVGVSVDFRMRFRADQFNCVRRRRWCRGLSSIRRGQKVGHRRSASQRLKINFICITLVPVHTQELVVLTNTLGLCKSSHFSHHCLTLSL